MVVIKDRRLRLLLLGGSTEANLIATECARDPFIDATLSLAGRTANPLPSPIATRVGGFGGIDGLALYLEQNDIHAVVDATHPFAAQISANAVAACKIAGVPLIAVERPAWQVVDGDRWTGFANVESAVATIGDRPRVVFSGLGRLSLDALSAAPQHRYIVRVIDAPEPGAARPNIEFIVGRGPFRFEDETELMRSHGVELVLSKNSGGGGAYAKIAAARTLGIEVFMIERPRIPARNIVCSAREAFDWVRAHVSSRIERGV